MSVVLVWVWGSPSWMLRLGTLWIAIVVFSFGFIRIVVNQIYLASQGKGAAVPMFEKKLGPLLYSEDKGWLNFMNKEGMPYEAPLRSREELSQLFQDLELHVSHRVVPADLLLIAFATLLTGFGDLMFCVFRAVGVPACSS
ncbi:hypothetical protein [Alkalilacustris brevis]|uniref:hypothetical protein n=1 Tax=Alkalilacustris brevis TaxID=2026338 RepID=UPI0013905ECE|nr:hypothetical protein [Alkalilacustris brevis]